MSKAKAGSGKKRKTLKKNPFEFFSVASDIMALRRSGLGWEVLLIQRRNPPYRGHWALPGGFLDRKEDALQAAKREFREETGLGGLKFYEFGSFSNPFRDPRGRTVTIAFYTVVSRRGAQAVAGDDAADACWFPITKLPPLAFDHREMIRKGWSAFTLAEKKNSLAK